MIIVPIQDVFFNDEATLAMGVAFDQACRSFRHLARAGKVRELIAKRIVEAARIGEIDPFRVQSQAIVSVSIDNVSVPVVNAGRAVRHPHAKSNRWPILAVGTGCSSLGRPNYNQSYQFNRSSSFDRPQSRALRSRSTS